MSTVVPFLAIAIFAVAFFFIATEKIDKVKVVLVASGVMALTGLIPGSEVFFSEHEGIDWNVIFLLLGMMIIVGVIRQTGLFEFLGIWAAKRSRGRPYRLMVMLMLITAVASPILDNVTIIMLVVPVTIVVCNRLHIPAQPYLIAEILASNIGGAATLIGDPPNIIIANRAGLSFNDFLVHMAPIVVIVFVLFVLLTYVLFRKEFRYNAEHVEAVMALQEGRAIKDKPLLIRCLIILAFVIFAFAMPFITVNPSVIALLGGGVMALVSGMDAEAIVGEVEWSTLVFFAGLFVMVSGLVHTGVITAIGDWAVSVVGDNYFVAATTLLFGSAVLGAFFDNIPYAATMAPIVEGLTDGISDPRTEGGMWWAFALGADFGGNGTAVAASANVVGISLAGRAGHPISFWQFTRYGIIVTIFTTLIAWAYVYLRYFA
ncbi:MAG: ArsB/NhaD family transporter [Propionibacteriales bacterium]|nr:ArsB/NhaD family transporter [Propionibacteriales bacterium]